MSVNIRYLQDNKSRITASLVKYAYEIMDNPKKKVMVVFNIPSMESLRILEGILRSSISTNDSIHIDVFDESSVHLFGSVIGHNAPVIRQTSLEQEFGLI
jgi:hypothetical protein